MNVLLVVVGAMLATVLLVGVGDRLRLPWPVLLLLLGALAAFVPGIDAPAVDPELILPLFLPPLLFATAQRRRLARRARKAAVDELGSLDRTALGLDDEVGQEVVDGLRAHFARMTAALSDDVPRDDVDPDEARNYRERIDRLRRRRETYARVEAVALAAAPGGPRRASRARDRPPGRRRRPAPPRRPLRRAQSLMVRRVGAVPGWV